MGVQISLQYPDFIYFGCLPRSGLLDYMVVLLSIFKNLHTIFQGGYTNLHCYQQCIRSPFSSHPCLLSLFFFFFKLIYFICLFLAALGLHCCAQAFCSCGEQWILFITVLRLLIAVASLVVEHRL